MKTRMLVPLFAALLAVGACGEDASDEEAKIEAAGERVGEAVEGAAKEVGEAAEGAAAEIREEINERDTTDRDTADRDTL